MDRTVHRNVNVRTVLYAHTRRVNAAVRPVGGILSVIVPAISIIMVKTVNSSVIAKIMPVVIHKMALALVRPAGWAKNAIRNVSRLRSGSAVSYNANVMRIIRLLVTRRAGSVSASRVGEVGFRDLVVFQGGWGRLHRSKQSFFHIQSH